MNFYFNRMELKNADYFTWKDKAFITLREFIYLAAGYEPLPVGYEPLPEGKIEQHFDLKNQVFKDFYKQIKNFGDKLPKITTEEEIVQCCPISGEAQYEAAFLIKWAEEMSINLHQNLSTAFKKQTTNLDSADELLNKIASSKTYELLVWIYEKHYKNKKSFPAASIVLSDIKKEFNNNSNHSNGKTFLSSNDSQVLHNVMRMVLNLKKGN